MNRIALANAVAAVVGIGPLGDDTFVPRPMGGSEMAFGQVALANDSLITQSMVNTELTEYAIGWDRANKLRTVRDFIAPNRSRATRKVTTTSYVNADAFQTVDPTKRKRAIGADHLDVPQPTWTKSTVQLANVGLQICLDSDQLKEQPNLERIATQWLMDILLRADVYEAVALLDAGATNAAKTWDATTNPDYDIKSQAKLSRDLTGVWPNSGLAGDAAMLLRMAAYEAAARANGAGAAAAINGVLTARTGLDRFLENAEAYTSSSTARTEFVGSHVYLFTAVENEGMVDPSNIVRLTSPASYGGGDYAVYVNDPTPKKRIVMVEGYAYFHAQHVLGMRDIVVS